MPTRVPTFTRLLAVSALSAAGIGTVLAPTGNARAAFDCASGPTYTVVSGDSWYAIAGRSGIGVRDVLAANGARLDDTIVPGDRLCLPDGVDHTAMCSSTYTVVSGDSWYAIARRSGTTPSELAASNGVGTDAALFPGDRICAPVATTGTAAPTSGGTYVVRRGDGWFRIADRSGVTVSDLLALNDARLGDLLLPGDEIALPAGARRTPALEALPAQGPCWYSDTWGAARDNGRSHRGTDVFTVRGQYVYAVAGGTLTGRVWAGSGRISGNAWTLTASDGTKYFYAHLADFAPDLSVGASVRAGQIIGWVGDTGNASSPHLHLEMRPGGGEPVNPYPLLRAAGGCNRGAPYTQPGGWVPDRVG